MANPMGAREAWEIVKGGNPMHRRYPEEWEVMRYARACAIVEACVEEHEAREAKLKHDELEPARNAGPWYAKAVPLALALTAAVERARALERGEEGK